MKKSIEITKGSIFKNLFLFTVPIILTGVLQLCYNAADVIVVGRYAGSSSLAAVGSTSSLMELMTNLFIGLSVGTNVCVAQYFGISGENADRAIKKTVHTSIMIALICGIGLMAAGCIFSKKFLFLMSTPDDIIDEAARYMRLLFCGMPASLVYNFGAATLRAAGDTKHPLIFLSIAGVVNIFLNLLFVIVFRMGAEGVGTATLISEYISAGLTMCFLARMDGPCKFSVKEMKMDFQTFWRILKIGIPAGLQGVLFGISNVQIQSSVNQFGSLAIAGNSAAANIEGFAFISMLSMQHSLTTFVGQNVGAGKKERMNKIILTGCFQVTVIGILVSYGILYFIRPLLRLYIPTDPAALEFGVQRSSIILPTYFLCGLMNAFVGAIRGMGSSFTPMCVSVLGICVYRLVWIQTAFVRDRTLHCLYLSYPISWILTAVVLGIICAIFVIKFKKGHLNVNKMLKV